MWTRISSQFDPFPSQKHISRNLEVRVRSGVMIDAEERRTLQEIDDAKQIRKVVQADSDAIDAERAAIEELESREVARRS